MTLCMAALCADEKTGAAAVVAADRMLTYGGFIEFEHAVPKMVLPSPYTVALIAGDTLLGTRLAQGVAAEFSGTAPRVDEIADRAAHATQAPDPTPHHRKTAEAGPEALKPILPADLVRLRVGSASMAACAQMGRFCMLGGGGERSRLRSVGCGIGHQGRG